MWDHPTQSFSVWPFPTVTFCGGHVSKVPAGPWTWLLMVALRISYSSYPITECNAVKYTSQNSYQIQGLQENSGLFHYLGYPKYPSLSAGGSLTTL